MTEDTPASPALDHLGPGVSAKIRDAIKAKLVELAVYVDDELPDYIMVMVANRKSPEQMKQDLGLFLNEHNQVFVDWLDHVLQQLQKVAQEGRGKKKVPKKKVRKEAESPVRKTKKKKPVTRSEPDHEEYHSVTEEVQHRKRDTSGRSRSRSRSRSPRLSERDRDHRPSSTRRPESRANHTRDKDYRPVTRAASPGRHFSSRRRSGDRSRASSAPRRGPSSVVGAVISHESDGEYDPEQILKRALVASKVQVPRPPPPAVSASKNLVLKAVADADRSLKRRRMDERDRDLKAVHEKRALLSQARREGNLDDRALKAITRERSPLPVKAPRKPASSPERRSRSSKIHRESRSRKRVNSPPRIKGMRADEEEEKRQKLQKAAAVQPPSPPRPSPPPRAAPLGDLDLRYHLGQRKLGTSLNKLARQSGLTIKVRNDLHRQNVGRDQEPREQDKEDDSNLESMRQKALESMKKRALRRSPSHDDKKIIIPLNEDSSDDDTDCDASAAEKETVDGSTSSSDSRGPNLAVKKQSAPSKDPQFIVTLQGIDKKYFKKAKIEPPISPPATKPVSPTDQPHQPKLVALSAKKPEAKVAPSIRSETKPLRKRITAPEPDPVVLPVPSAPLIQPRLPIVAFAPKMAASPDRPVCKFWPRCTRGEACFFFHPKSNPASTHFSAPIHKPAMSRIPSKEKLTWTSASAKPL
ncbi:hypothetical protein TCAL_06758 [Tigriopus californicus]|uniref:Zinc finger CCCH domain-containing protein 14 n=1 Tax=Tigriopus californicus TaxID=6832 RepID=A0A553PMC7_TIGCA|nr:zinc finger CCCH domain-containing protein 14-like [Tigriopus californicus]TRY78838.1 hypothetical protein TCAL_06758 [Tigriopus californicus]|eukprot:TCALIF_06758-PA protein Name:"Similar to zc3h14 Zinc finger CCCH domain-containing protein 14 (Danio rerio)" AED:0.00 eAED:0.00 QI:140/1/1/1/1/1/2/1594/696